MDISGIEYREDEKEMEIRQLMNLYPQLDWLMCRTLLMHTEEELGELIEKSKNLPKQDISRNMVVKSVKINDE